MRNFTLDVSWTGEAHVDGKGSGIGATGTPVSRKGFERDHERYDLPWNLILKHPERSFAYQGRLSGAFCGVAIGGGFGSGTACKRLEFYSRGRLIVSLIIFRGIGRGMGYRFTLAELFPFLCHPPSWLRFPRRHRKNKEPSNEASSKDTVLFSGRKNDRENILRRTLSQKSFVFPPGSLE